MSLNLLRKFPVKLSLDSVGKRVLSSSDSFLSKNYQEPFCMSRAGVSNSLVIY